jgi:glycine/D-amino acid oxidase-like deaminating enzyme
VSQVKQGIGRRAFNRFILSSMAMTSAANSASAEGDRRHIAVIGAGIVGSSIAYNLAKQGARVTLIDRSTVGGATSHGTFAWINATWAKQPRHYHAFNQLGIEAWHRLQSELNVPVRWGGSLEWFSSETRQRRLADDITEQQLWGEPARMIGVTEAEGLEPAASFGGAERIAYSPRDGAVDARFASQRMVKAAEKLGLTLLENCAVSGATTAGNGQSVLQTTCGDINVDKYVIATGADPEATQSLAGIDIPQRSTPGVIVVTEPLSMMLNTIFVAPGVHIHQRLDGRIILGEQDGAPDTAAHKQRLASYPTRFPSEDIAQQHANRLIATARQFLPSLPQDIAVEEVVIGWRPLPLDGHPVIGPSPAATNSYIAIMHSGVSLGPVVGEMVSDELINDTSRTELSPYRAARDFQRIKRY